MNRPALLPKLKDAVNALGRFSSHEVEQVVKRFQHRVVHKGEALVSPGEICNEACFVISGALYRFRVDDIDEQVIDLYPPGYFAVDSESLVQQKPASTCIKVFTTGEVFSISLHDVHALIETSSNFFQLGKILYTVSPMVQLAKQNSSPAERYESFEAHLSDWFQYFPLKMIASFLNMTPETLSRVRNRRQGKR